jgi:DNA repair protein RadA/Sms
MAKPKTIFVCQQCGATASKWMGRCAECGQWNSFVEELVHSSALVPGTLMKNDNRPVLIEEIVYDEEKRLITRNTELDKVLGGGLVEGSITLLGGEPGIGKSTLSLQIALGLKDKKVLYVSGEESAKQIKMRSQRMAGNQNSSYLLCEVSLENIIGHIEQIQPDLVVVDSIQTTVSGNIESSAGTISQVRESAARLQQLAKKTGIPVILIGHITKDGNIAGPKVLEHIVDTVLQFEGDHQHLFRILRPVKNRFGSTSEIGLFEMTDKGLIPVEDPSGILLGHRENGLSGICVASTVNGARSFLIEIQALVSSAAYGTPQRSAIGFDTRRLNMLLAVLEKRAGFHLSSKDVFLNIAGGLKLNDPGLDLAIVSAVLSSSSDIAVDTNDAFAAEISLSGEVRPVTHIEQRIKEAERLGFRRVFLSAYNKKNILGKYKNIELVYLKTVHEMVKKTFG